MPVEGLGCAAWGRGATRRQPTYSAAALPPTGPHRLPAFACLPLQVCADGFQTDGAGGCVLICDVLRCETCSEASTCDVCLDGFSPNADKTGEGSEEGKEEGRQGGTSRSQTQTQRAPHLPLPCAPACVLPGPNQCFVTNCKLCDPNNPTRCFE